MCVGECGAVRSASLGTHKVARREVLTQLYPPIQFKLKQILSSNHIVGERSEDMASKKPKDFIKWAQEKPNIYDENGNFVDWKKHFRETEE